jgi:hypothetical protein
MLFIGRSWDFASMMILKAMYGRSVNARNGSLLRCAYASEVTIPKWVGSPVRIKPNTESWVITLAGLIHGMALIKNSKVCYGKLKLIIELP